MSPTQRALADARKEGYTAAIVERFNPHSKTRHDLFGFADLLLLTGANIVAVQVTSGANHSARLAKIRAEPKARDWIQAGGLIEVWSYAKRGARGKRKLWTLRREAIVLEDLQEVA